jgi:predicted Fe-Mo cluster-binding NifX family protein
MDIIASFQSTRAFNHLKAGYIRELPEETYATLVSELTKLTAPKCSSTNYASSLAGSFFTRDKDDTLIIPAGLDPKNPSHMDWVFIQEGYVIQQFTDLLLIYCNMWISNIKEQPTLQKVHQFFGECQKFALGQITEEAISSFSFPASQQSPLARPDIPKAEEAKVQAKPSTAIVNRHAMLQKIMVKEVAKPVSKQLATGKR